MRIYKSYRYRLLALLLNLQQHVCGQVLLLPFACCYHMLVALRVLLYRYLLPRHTLPARTISVGNIVSGGSGKTPTVITIGQQLLARGEQLVVLSRGYGSNLRRAEFVVLQHGKVVLGKTSVRNLDEPLLLSHALPQAVVIVAVRRYTALQAYLTSITGAAPTCFLLDDGFQHLQIKRDLDIVLLDAAQPFADGKLLPRGLLREPPRALRRADLVLFTRATTSVPAATYIQQVRDYVIRTENVPFHNDSLQPAPATKITFNTQLNPVLFICGVAAPERVLAVLPQLQVQVQAAIYLADHEAVDRRMVQRYASQVKALVMTAKDYWRDREFYDEQALPVFTVALTVAFDFSKQLDPLSIPS